MEEFKTNNQELQRIIDEWVPKLLSLTEEIISTKRNSQNRTIKQIVGHMIDSASNNSHRMIHMQYQPSPLIFPNYATNGNNDKWIAIQNYQAEDWKNMINLWKYSNLHIMHVIENVDSSKLENLWHYNEEGLISLKASIIGYLQHIKLHIAEINELINSK